MVKIIYASVTGNTEKIARDVLNKLQASEKFDNVEIFSADEIDVSLFDQENIYIIATSTWNLGQMNQYLEELYAQIDGYDLSGVKIAFIGLGDRVYGEENFNRSMYDFRERALEGGAEEINEPLVIDGDPSELKEEVIDEWAATITN